jgi:hypothetical protein
MPRFSIDQLRQKALAVLEDAAAEAKDGPVRRTLGLRFALAFLANFAEDRWPFDWFWRSLAEENDIMRGQNAKASLNAIYAEVGTVARPGER